MKSETSTQIHLRVNGDPRHFESTLSVAELLGQLDLAAARVAVMVNGEVAPRETHENRSLHDGDEVEVISMVGGG